MAKAEMTNDEGMTNDEASFALSGIDCLASRRLRPDYGASENRESQIEPRKRLRLTRVIFFLKWLERISLPRAKL
jgi:hypothetical protein